MKLWETLTGAVGAVLLVAAGAVAVTIPERSENLFGAVILALLGGAASHYALRKKIA